MLLFGPFIHKLFIQYPFCYQIKVLIHNLDEFLNTEAIGDYSGLKEYFDKVDFSKMSNPEAIKSLVDEGKPCSFFIHYPGHVMCVNIAEIEALGLSNLGGILDLNDGKFKEKLKLKEIRDGQIVRPGTKYFISEGDDAFKSSISIDFIKSLMQLKEGDNFIATNLYDPTIFKNLGFMESEGQLVGNCGFIHPQQCILEHILFSVCASHEDLKTLVDNASLENLPKIMAEARVTCEKFKIFAQLKSLQAFNNQRQAILNIFTDNEDIQESIGTVLDIMYETGIQKIKNSSKRLLESLAKLNPSSDVIDNNEDMDESR